MIELILMMKSYRPLHRCKGIILSSAPYRDADAALTLFTESQGLMHMIAAGAFRPRSPKQTAPFTEGEFLYSLGRDTLHSCKEITPHTMHLALRGDFELLKAACTMARALKLSQLPQKSAPMLYSLFASYLRALPKEPGNSAALAASFQLKLLGHDGLMRLSASCAACHAPLEEQFHCRDGESFCRGHAPPHAFLFTRDEGHLLLKLAHSRSFRELGGLAMPEALAKRIDSFFAAHLS